MESGTLSISLPSHLFGGLNTDSFIRHNLVLSIDGIVSIKSNALIRNWGDSFQGYGFYEPATTEVGFLLSDMQISADHQEQDFPFARTCAKTPSNSYQTHEQ